MGFGKSFAMAISSIISNKVRAFLTMLGIIIGIAAVIILVSIMNGLTGMITDTFEEMGTETISVSIMSRATTKKVEPQEMFDLVNENPEFFSAVSPSVTMSATVKTAESGDDSITASAQGVSEDYADMKSLNLSFGRFLQYVDCDR